jgi:hypothetical protein
MIDKLDRFLAVAFRYELHAFVMLLTGIVVYLHGIHDQGQVIIGAALLIFKGKAQAS